MENKNFNFTTDELKNAAIKICQLGQEMEYEPDQWAIIVSMVGRHLSDAQGIEVKSEKRMDA